MIITCIIIRQNSTSLSNYSTNFLSLLADFYNWEEVESFNVRLSRRQDVSFDSYNGVTVHGSDNVYGKALRRMAFTKPNVEAGLSK